MTGRARCRSRGRPRRRPRLNRARALGRAGRRRGCRRGSRPRPQLQERQQEVVVAGVEGELRLGEDAPSLAGIGRRLLDRRDVRDLGELRERLGLEVDDDPLRDVVDDDRPVGGGRDRLGMSHDPARGRLVVVRRDDEEAVDAELVSLPGQWTECAVEYVPVPAITVARSPTASTAAAKRDSRSSSLSVGASPVVPATTTPSEPSRRDGRRGA